MHLTMPADFETQSALIFSAVRLGRVFPETFVRLIEELITRLPLIILVNSEEQRSELLTICADEGLPGHLLYFIRSPSIQMWVRDYGPQFIRRADGGLDLVDADYFIQTQPNEDVFPQELASLLRMPFVRVPLGIEGGNILSNGRGLCLTTEEFLRRNAERQMSVDELGRQLKAAYGFTQVVVLEKLVTEQTGHVDMFATFTAPDVVVVGQYDPRIDPINADVLDRNSATLSTLQTPLGPLQVHRIPMPTNHGGVWRTYTNVLFANGLLLIPAFGAVDPAGEARALELYRQLLPDWEMKTVDTSGLVQGRGALRCLCAPIPWHKRIREQLTDEPSSIGSNPI